MKKIIAIFVVTMLCTSIMSTSAFARGRHNDRRNQHNQHHRHNGDNVLGAFIGAVAATAVLNAMQPREVIYYPPQQQYYPQQAPRADVCYKYVRRGYIDEWGRFVQKGRKRIKVQCR